MSKTFAHKGSVMSLRSRRVPVGFYLLSAFALPALAAPAAHAQSWLPTVMEFRKPEVGLCIDIHGPDYDANRNGALAQLWTCNGSQNQRFRFEWLTNGFANLIAPNGKCLDVDAAGFGAKTTGAKVQLWTCNGRLNQQFMLPDGKIAMRNGMCLDVAPTDLTPTRNGVPLRQASCVAASSAPKWSWGLLAPTTVANPQTFKFIELRTDYQHCMDADLTDFEYGRTGARVSMWPCKDLPNTKFRRFTRADGFENLVSANGMCLDVDWEQFNRGDNGAKVQLWTCNGQDNQKWTLEHAPASLKVVSKNGKCLDINGDAFNRRSDGAVVSLYTCHGGANQMLRRSNTDPPSLFVRRVDTSAERATWARPASGDSLNCFGGDGNPLEGTLSVSNLTGQGIEVSVQRDSDGGGQAGSFTLREAQTDTWRRNLCEELEVAVYTNGAFRTAFWQQYGSNGSPVSTAVTKAGVPLIVMAPLPPNIQDVWVRNDSDMPIEVSVSKAIRSRSDPLREPIGSNQIGAVLDSSGDDRRFQLQPAQSMAFSRTRWLDGKVNITAYQNGEVVAQGSQPLKTNGFGNNLATWKVRRSCSAPLPPATPTCRWDMIGQQY